MMGVSVRSQGGEEDFRLRPGEPRAPPCFSAFEHCQLTPTVDQLRLCPVPAELIPPFEDLSDLEPKFDPTIHLAVQAPEKITLLDFAETKQTPPVDGPCAQSSLAYTSAFRFLSDEGVRVLREIIERNSKHIKSCDRQPRFIRGLAYTSKFLRDLNEHPAVLNVLSSFAGQPLVPHYMPSNYAHINIGRPPPSASEPSPPVDQWHADSVPFVLIIILSDLQDMQGGELQCVRRKCREAGFALIEETQNNVPASELLNVSYEKKGYALFMQGSEIVHHVTGVTKAREPRITLINSYMPANCFARDRTVYATFLCGAEPQAGYEFARGRAWRSAQQLQAFVERQPFTESPYPLIDHLSRVISELQMTVDLLANRVSDKMDYYHEDKHSKGTNTASTDVNTPSSALSPTL